MARRESRLLKALRVPRVRRLIRDLSLVLTGEVVGIYWYDARFSADDLTTFIVGVGLVVLLLALIVLCVNTWRGAARVKRAVRDPGSGIDGSTSIKYHTKAQRKIAVSVLGVLIALGLVGMVFQTTTAPQVLSMSGYLVLPAAIMVLHFFAWVRSLRAETKSRPEPQPIKVSSTTMPATPSSPPARAEVVIPAPQPPPTFRPSQPASPPPAGMPMRSSLSADLGFDDDEDDLEDTGSIPRYIPSPA